MALSADVATKVSTDAAEKLVQTFYPALQSNPTAISSFYMPPAAMPDGKPLPAIVYNGNIIPDAATFQTMIQRDMATARYEVQAYDCHVLNPNYVVDGMEAGNAAGGKNMTILVSVSGHVKFGGRDSNARGFSENFVLIPNHDAASKGRGKHGKEWLIQSQNFRLVV
ncbi:nuclear transport factor 2 domain protein [Lasallia pustulata]|uniref:Nuclear transport factor 2 domain protein n=1 Tax=Lasallia pustulata TaxID=136370 RepID=A0A1W5CZI1_9LECA|nr:nuclear transport factor 2 domain protein [Lasallia pustulata]